MPGTVATGVAGSRARAKNATWVGTSADAVGTNGFAGSAMEYRKRLDGPATSWELMTSGTGRRST